MLLVILVFLSFKYILHCLIFVLYFFFIIFLQFWHSYQIMDLDKVFTCSTLIVIFTILFKRTPHLFDFSLILFINTANTSTNPGTLVLSTIISEKHK